MTPRFDPDTISFLISDVARLLRAEFDRRTSDAGMGLTPGEARALVSAARAGAIRQGALADRMGVEPMTLSTYLDRLEARGLVRREADPTDRRAKLVQVTDEAHAVLEAIGRIGTELREDISATLAPQLIEEIRDGLKEIRTRLIELRPECSKGSAAA
ncbi:MarR family transcriptional regulator [Mesorhizobium sp. CAU 1741]|uniref:MarR family winged helix-turn-helix transcriptional regulator n=1 Tax=Mesorhizobium sp. CAU 1741 TaxID=3140366 RepID=UPI00325BA8DF